MAEQFSGTLLPQNQNVEETQKTALDLLSKINKVSQSAENALNAAINNLPIPTPYTPPAWTPYPAGTYVFPSGNQTVAEGVLAIGATTTAPTKATTNISKAWYRDWGATIDIMFFYQHANSSGAVSGSGTYIFPLPLGKLLDTAIVTTSAVYNGTKFSGIGISGDAGGGVFLDGILSPHAYSTALLDFPVIYGLSSGTGAGGSVWGSACIGFAIGPRFCVSGTITGIPIQ